MKYASGVKIVPLDNNFTVVRSDVHLTTSPGYFLVFPPTVRRVRYGSSFGGARIHNNLPIYNIFPYFSGILFWCRKNIVSVTFTLTPTTWDILLISLAEYLIQTCQCFFNNLSVLHGKTCVLINDCIGHFVQTVVLCHWLGISCKSFLDSVGYHIWCVILLIVCILQPFWMLCIVIWCSPVYWLWLKPWWCILVLLIYDDGCGCWFLPFCGCWSFQVASKFHPWGCGSLGWTVIF